MQAFVYILGLVFVRCTILHFTWSTFTFVNYRCYSIAAFDVFIANKAFLLSFTIALQCWKMEESEWN